MRLYLLYYYFYRSIKHDENCNLIISAVPIRYSLCNVVDNMRSATEKCIRTQEDDDDECWCGVIEKSEIKSVLITNK